LVASSPRTPWLTRGALGGRQIAGTRVNRKGTAKKLVSTVAGGQAGGAVGSFAAERLAGRSSVAVLGTPEFGRDAYLAVGENDVALVRAKQGLMKLRVTDEVVARAARSEVSRIELGTGKLACPMTITFSDEDGVSSASPGPADRPPSEL
jgi:hypothetical protein